MFDFSFWLKIKQKNKQIKHSITSYFITFARKSGHHESQRRNNTEITYRKR